MSTPLGSSQWMYSSGAEVTQQSLKFNDDESQYLSWTPASAGNRKTWTWSGWVKRGNLGTTQQLFHAKDGANYVQIGFTTANKLQIQLGTPRRRTNRLFRDVGAWYHIVAVVDTTDATGDDRLQLWVNGERQTSFDEDTDPTLNADYTVNNTVQHHIGRGDATHYTDGYLSDIHFIDGQALDPTSFGQFTNGYWEAKDYAGSYGTNGFHLTFADDVVSEGFNAVTYRGNNGQNSVSGLGLSPDLVWIKSRTGTQSHILFDSVRGPSARINTNSTAAETGPDGAGVDSFDADGFTMNDSSGAWNSSSYNYVAWCWDAGSGSAASNTDGSITSTVKANPSYGFSITSYVGTGTAGTIGHGLSSAPEMVIVKNRSRIAGWKAWHSGLADSTYIIELHDPAGESVNTTAFNSTAPTSSVFSVGNSYNDTNLSGDNFIAYCFHSVSGYSSIGSYTGTGAAGNAVNCGFRPAFVMVKRTDTTGNWFILDNTRSADNKGDDYLYPDLSNAEDSNLGSSYLIDFTATGFTIQNAQSYDNASGGTYIYMAFADTREAAFWKDVSGQGNHWTPNNLDYRDSLIDSPANNWCTLNPLSSYSTITLAEGNLKASETANVGRTAFSSIALENGKWYFEAYVQTAGTYVGIGLSDNSYSGSSYSGDSANSYGYLSHTGSKYNNGAATSYGATFTTGDIVAAAFDVTTGTLTFYKNGVSQGTAFTGITIQQFFTVTSRNGVIIANFGQDSTFAGNRAAGGNTDDNGIGDFAHPVPAGFLALCSANLPTSTIIDGSEHFNTVLWTGDNTSNRSITVGFEPDFVWLKNRNGTFDHRLWNSIIPTYRLVSNSTASEVSTFGAFDTNANGINVWNTVNDNNSGVTYVAWNWKAGGTAVSNSDGSITSQVSANVDAGFSIVSYTGTGANATVGHGLGVQPEMIITKVRSGISYWLTYHSGLASPSTSYMALNTTDAVDTGGASVWNSTSPTSSVFSVGTSTWINPSGGTMIAYCFANSDIIKVGSYTGNGSSDGTFVYTGFRPAWVMVKNASLAATSWLIWDDERSTYNIANDILKAQSANAEVVNNNSFGIDVLSNGFKVRSSYGDVNQSGNTIIYLAIAEHPFKYANAR